MQVNFTDHISSSMSFSQDGHSNQSSTRTDGEERIQPIVAEHLLDRNPAAPIASEQASKRTFHRRGTSISAEQVAQVKALAAELQTSSTQQETERNSSTSNDSSVQSDLSSSEEEHQEPVMEEISSLDLGSGRRVRFSTRVEEIYFAKYPE